MSKHRTLAESAPQRLAGGPVAAVDLCPCGGMLLRIGPIMLRLRPEAITSLLRTLEEAVARHRTLDARSAPRPSMHSKVGQA